MDPGDIDRALENARRLAESDRPGEAREAYLRIVAAAPDHPRALTDFGTFLVRGGFRAAARTVYERAVAVAPQSALAHANLAGVLYAANDYEGARRAYEAALALDPGMAAAHQGLSYALTRLDREDDALLHRRLGFAGRAVSTAPYRGTGRAVDVLLLVAARGGTIYTESFLDDRTFRITTLVADAYDGAPLPAADVIFNAIADADRAAAELHTVAALLKNARTRVLNPPARVLATTREAGAARLRALEGVVAPRIARAERAGIIADPAGTAARLGFTFPLLVRAPGFHTGQHFAYAANAGELAAAVGGFPGTDALLVEYIDTRNSDGAARKFRVMVIGGAVYPLHAAAADDWKVHYASAGMERDAAKRAEDERFLADPRAAIGAAAYAALERMYDEIRLDYMGIDFALDRAGRVVVFEANATMIVLPPGPGAMWDYRRAPVERVLGAAKKLLLRHNETAPPTA
jgi:glutathione synthase/RimK-type ligase-like ATP-grasp enzyme